MQSKRGSLLESVTGTVVGFVIAMIIQVTVPPLFGAKLALHQDFAIVGIFTVASIIRQYILRRIFNNITVKRATYVKRY